MRTPVDLPAGWEPVRRFAAVQMVAVESIGAADAALAPLGPADVPAMLALTRATNPGPFLTRTIELGSYLGVIADGELVAMAGERMRLPGWTEVSAVCTAPSHRGQGLAARLIGAVAAGIEARGDRAFLHAVTTNAGALRLYEALGFGARRELAVAVVTPPAGG